MEFDPRIRRYLKFGIGIALLATGLYFFRSPILYAIRLLALSGIISLLLCPVCRIFEKKLSCSLSALLSLLTASVFLCIILTAVLIPICKGFYGIYLRLPEITERMQPFLSTADQYLHIDIDRNISGSLLADKISKLLPAVTSGASGLVGTLSSLVIALVISWHLLTGRRLIALRCELLIPVSLRQKVLRSAHELMTELGLYLRGQTTIAFCVGLLSAAGLFLSGIDSAIPLGFTAGILNMVPYLGPVIACIPVTLLALQDGFVTALLGIGVLIAVQQIDGLFLSPRIVGNSTGFSPIAVIIAVFSFGAVWNVFGMLFALPALIFIRTCVRVFVELAHND